MAELDCECILREPTNSEYRVVPFCSLDSHETSEAEEYETKRGCNIVDGDVELLRQQRIPRANHRRQCAIETCGERSVYV